MYVNSLNMKLNNNVVTTLYNIIKEKANTYNFQKGYFFDKIFSKKKRKIIFSSKLNYFIHKLI